jgi:ABC-type cobalamin transport system ATPase subunit
MKHGMRRIYIQKRFKFFVEQILNSGFLRKIFASICNFPSPFSIDNGGILYHLIFDEATANIDTATEELLEEILAKLPKETTKIIIAHRLNAIKKC